MTKILVLHDQPHMFRFIRFLLERAGYESVQARDSSEALRLIETEQPDVVLVNGELLEDTRAALRTLKETGARARPVIWMSARPVTAGWASDGKADVVISQPFSPARLVADIRRLLSHPE